MRDFRLHIVFLLVLTFGVSAPVLAQKSKIKAQRKSQNADSSRAISGGKAALKARIPQRDSLIQTDSMPVVDEMPAVSSDSVGKLPGDSIRPQPKKFYTRVTATQLQASEQRVVAMQERLEQAESTLDDYQNEEGESPSFTEEELAAFAAAIERARAKIVAADSVLVMVRARLLKEGKLQGDQAGAAGDDLNLEDDADGTGEQALPVGTGKGQLKRKSGGKSALKRNQELDIDDDDAGSGPPPNREPDIDD